MKHEEAMRPAAIRTTGLTKRYGSTVALDGLDLVVEPGSVFGFLGPNGAGKTTTIRMLIGAHRPTAGHAEVLGLDCTAQRDEIHRRVGYLPGDFVAYPDLTGAQYLGFLAALRGGVDASKLADLVDRFELEVERRIGALSRGNRQKLGIVQAFMHDPELVVLDEPTSGLDPLMQRVFRNVVSAARDDGRTVFLSSHVLGEVEEIADTVGVVRAGRLVVVEALEELKEHARRQLELTFHGDVPVDALRGLPGVEVLEVVGRTARLVVVGPMDAVFRIAAPAGIENVVAQEPPLEEILLGYYGTSRS
ncbi:MAG: ABC transporter ATP-binding protein [Acidimicrobiia bacterium]